MCTRCRGTDAVACGIGRSRRGSRLRLCYLLPTPISLRCIGFGIAGARVEVPLELRCCAVCDGTGPPRGLGPDGFGLCLQGGFSAPC